MRLALSQVLASSCQGCRCPREAPRWTPRAPGLPGAPGQRRLLTGLSKYSGRPVRRRASSPKLQVLNTALMSA